MSKVGARMEGKSEIRERRVRGDWAYLELIKPGGDPRAEFRELGFDANVTELAHVRKA